VFLNSEIGAKNYRSFATLIAMAPIDNDSPTGSDTGSTRQNAEIQDELAELIARLISREATKKDFLRLAKLLRGYLKIGRKGVSFNGKGLADLLFYIAPRLPVRDIDALHKAYGGVTGGTLAGQVIKSASHKSAAVGGATGALATAGQLAPPMWVTLPAEILAETLVVTAVEMRMIAELHEVYGLPLRGTADERGAAIVEAWSTRRGVDMKRLQQHGRTELNRDGGVGKHLVRVVKRKLMTRAARNLGTLAPLFIGAAIGAETNRRSTRDIGNAIVRDLVERGPGDPAEQK
jgi:hypothetical protein